MSDAVAMPIGLKVYQSTAQEDLLIAGWWYKMLEAGDLDNLFTQDSRTLAALFRLVTPPRAFVYAADARGIWFALWGEPLLGAVAIGLWLRPDRRSRVGTLMFLETLDWALQQAPVIIGVTKQEKLLRAHRRLGYTVVGAVPRFFDGETGWIVAVTRESLAAPLARYRRQPVCEVA